ncbi:MAG: hypothetical protein LBI26_02520 [Holosporales bacterium]|jgi:hypothetical protein|nr:hypothetical protein [Holosporales bacterium]
MFKVLGYGLTLSLVMTCSGISMESMYEDYGNKEDSYVKSHLTKYWDDDWRWKKSKNKQFQGKRFDKRLDKKQFDRPKGVNSMKNWDKKYGK